MKNYTNSTELKCERIRRRRGIQYMADLIGRSYSSYRKKEAGEVPFTVDEIMIISKDFDLTLTQVHVIFLGGKLPNSSKAIN